MTTYEWSSERGDPVQARETDANRGFRGGNFGLEDLGDDECLWEPVRGCWSVRRRGESVGAQAYGPGEWQPDFELNPPKPPLVTTIAWRLGHLTSGIAGRWEWTFGSRRRPPEDLVDVTPHAGKALAE